MEPSPQSCAPPVPGQVSLLKSSNATKLTILNKELVLIESFHLSGHTVRFRLQENELSSVITQTVPLAKTNVFCLRELTCEFVTVLDSGIF